MIDLSPLEVLFALLIGHALADYPLQGVFIATHKSRHSPNPFEGEPHPWAFFLTSHALIHAGMVWLITGNIIFGLIELVLHWVIDFAKNEKVTNFIADQTLHILCKVGFVIAICFMHS